MTNPMVNGPTIEKHRGKKQLSTRFNWLTCHMIQTAFLEKCSYYSSIFKWINCYLKTEWHISTFTVVLGPNEFRKLWKLFSGYSCNWSNFICFISLIIILTAPFSFYLTQDSPSLPSEISDNSKAFQIIEANETWRCLKAI